MRIKTSRVLRYIDGVKDSISRRNSRFLRGFSYLTASLRSSANATLLSLLLIVAFCLHFAAFQLGMLVALGFFSLELYFYRLANTFFRVIKF